jgi:hypothetical protein
MRPCAGQGINGGGSVPRASASCEGAPERLGKPQQVQARLRRRLGCSDALLRDDRAGGPDDRWVEASAGGAVEVRESILVADLRRAGGGQSAPRVGDGDHSGGERDALAAQADGPATAVPPLGQQLRLVVRAARVAGSRDDVIHGLAGRRPAARGFGNLDDVAAFGPPEPELDRERVRAA